MLRNALLLLALLAPTALAIDPDRFPPREIHLDLILCTYDQTFHVDNSFTTVECGVQGTEVLHHRSGSGFAGYQCTTRVLGVTLHDCWDGLLP